MGRPGRRRDDREEREIRDSRKGARDEMIRQLVESKRALTAEHLALVAARVLLTLERGTPYQKAICKRSVKELLQFARKVGLHGKWNSDCDFLKDFISRHAPNWNWRDYIDDGTRAACEERYRKELAQMQRDSRAHRNRHVLPERPDPSRLIFLANRIKPNEPMT